MKHCQQEMTVIQNAWPVVCNFGWLIEADRNARKGKRYRAEVLNFTARLEDNLFTIQQGMMNGSYVLGPYRKLWVYVPKKRLVMALDYPDRIVQWSLYLYLNPLYDRLFIEDSYACRKDKGSHKAAKRLQYWMCQVQRKPGPGWYCLKLDISKYFYRVNHEKLLAILGRRVKDPAMMAFIRGVVNSRAEPFGLPRWRTPQDTPPEEWLYEVGMPIGNLTSQLFANIYLNELDQYCKHRLKIHYYIRYMDDVIILGQDKETLHRWKAAVETFLQEELALDLNSKTSIRPVRQGVEFVGVRIWPTHVTRDIMVDSEGYLTTGRGLYYAAQVEIPARKYTETVTTAQETDAQAEDGENAEGMSRETVTRTPEPLDTEDVTLYLFAIDGIMIH